MFTFWNKHLWPTITSPFRKCKRFKTESDWPMFILTKYLDRHCQRIVDLKHCLFYSLVSILNTAVIVKGQLATSFVPTIRNTEVFVWNSQQYLYSCILNVRPTRISAWNMTTFNNLVHYGTVPIGFLDPIKTSEGDTFILVMREEVLVIWEVNLLKSPDCTKSHYMKSKCMNLVIQNTISLGFNHLFQYTQIHGLPDRIECRAC